MSQEEVITWLENHPGWHMTAKAADGVRRDRENNQRASESLRRAWEANQIKRELREGRRAWWSAGKVYGSIKRLKKDGWIRTEKAERGGRSVLKIEPVKWHEFLTPEEIEEFKKGDSEV